ncbi:Mycobacterium rhizamassiliense ORFan [Mycobacterium rhizamassiliense]|jgi:hypothetical protein|uniref:Mycobacterium rhizamassiliense ORFan n=1 Tax=Mycobacterium rhizamassiliense TaxID=1841860 RepID=A0A2U3NNT7_9MYCO|nr:Mycobacterium rhizamassiliense ORFan [Mycobacterium rhizamassiliense]
MTALKNRIAASIRRAVRDVVLCEREPANNASAYSFLYV